MARAALAAAALAAAACVSPAASLAGPALQDLFAAYQGYPPCFRQPLLVVGAGGAHLFAFAEGRLNSYCSGTDDGDNSSIWVRTSADGGATWAPRQQLYDGHPDYLSAVHDPSSGRTHLFIEASPNQWTYTDDNGATWSPLAQPKVSIPAGYTATPGVAHGIALSGGLCPEPTCGGLVGRLIVAWVCHAAKGAAQEAAARANLRAHVRSRGDVACPGCYSCLATSDDGGSSWTIAAGGISQQEGSREASLAQLRSASVGASTPVVYASERNLGNVTGFRLHALSLDGGSTFASFGTDPGIPDGKVTNWTGIVAGVTRFDDDPSAPAAVRRVILSTPMNKVARADMALFHTTDETATWSAGALYRAGPAGYSDLGVLNATTAAIIFENGDDEFAQRISFGYISVADL